jgi:putative peptidoglycan lipid II flippase
VTAPSLRPWGSAGRRSGGRGSGDRHAGVAGDSVAVAAWTIVSRLTGFARVMTVAAVLGPTYLGNVYLAINTLPNIAYSVLTGSLFTRLLVPPLVRHIDEDDAEATSRVARQFVGWVVLLFSSVTTLVLLAGPLVLHLLSAGVGDAEAARQQREVGALLLVLLMPQLVLYGVVGVGEAVMNAHGRFSLPAAAPVLENLGIIATLAATAFIYGAGVPIGSVSNGEVLLLGLGTTGAVALHAGAQWLGARRAGVTLLPSVSRPGPEIRAIARRALPSAGTSALDALKRFGILVVTNNVPGGVVAFTVAQNFAALPSAIAARPVAVTVLPRLSRLFHQGHLQMFRDELARGVLLVALVTVPASAAYLLMAEPIGKAVTFGRMDQAVGVSLIAVSLVALAPGILGQGGLLVATSASYARDDARSPFRATLVGTAVTGAGAVASLALAGPSLLVAVGLSVSAGEMVNAWSLFRRIRAGLPATGSPVLPGLLRFLFGSVLMAASVLLVEALFPDSTSGRWYDGLELFVAAIVGSTVYVTGLLLCRSPELAELTRGLRARRGG